MTASDYQRMMRLQMDETTTFASQYLEDRGYRFGVNFGPSSAVRKATEEILMRIQEEEGYGI